MATLVVPQTVQVAIEMVASGQKVYNVLGFTNAFGSTPAYILNLVKTEWERTNGPLKLHTTATQMVGYHFTDLSSSTGATAFLGSTTAGGLAAALSTMASCALIKLSSGTRSRSGQGRLYHGPLAESQINSDGRQMDSTYQTSIALAYETFRINMAAGNCGWGVISRKNSAFTSITTTSCSGIIATQRRRLR
jgi:hypothetical protein